MNALKWARDLERERKLGPGDSKAKAIALEQIANSQCKHCGVPALMGLASSRRYFFQQLAKDAVRSVKERGVTGKMRRRTESVRAHTGQAYVERQSFTARSFEDRLRHCREQIAYYVAKGKELLRDAVSRGHRQLSLKFPEFKSGGTE